VLQEIQAIHPTSCQKLDRDVLYVFDESVIDCVAADI